MSQLINPHSTIQPACYLLRLPYVFIWTRRRLAWPDLRTEIDFSITVWKFRFTLDDLMISLRVCMYIRVFLLFRVLCGYINFLKLRLGFLDNLL